MKLKFLLLLMFFIVNLTSVYAILNPTFEPCSNSYYQKLWETIQKQPFTGAINPSIYHEGPDLDNECSNFDMNITIKGDGYKDIYYVAVTVNLNQKNRILIAGYFRVSDPDGKYQLPGDFVKRFLEYVYSTFSSTTFNRNPVLQTASDAQHDYATYLKGTTDLSKWITPTGMTGDFNYKEGSNNINEEIDVSKRLLAVSYTFTEPSTSQLQEPDQGLCKTGDTKHCDLPGICALGTQNCVNGVWSECSIGPRPEICNGLDDNCNGIVDENCYCPEGSTRSCIISSCYFGNQTCANATWTACTSQNPAPIGLNETCGNITSNNTILPPVITCDNNGIKDNSETGIDCGGPYCSPCPSCTDGILNEQETKVNVIIDSLGTKSDCGGPNCPPCPTCNDGIQNQGEQGIDCGGPCPKSCEEQKNEAPVCGDAYCDEAKGENPSNCPQDCSSIPIFPIIVLFFLIIPIIGLLVYLLIKKQSKKTKQQLFKIHPSFLKPQYKESRPDKLAEELKKIK